MLEELYDGRQVAGGEDAEERSGESADKAAYNQATAITMKSPMYITARTRLMSR